MCKIAGVTKITDKNRSDVWVFMQLLAEVISQGNDDGLGYASFNKKGEIFGEKWLINKTAFKDLSQIKGINSQKMDRIYSFFGDQVLRNEAQAIILHTRAATGGKGIQNTHPFINNVDKPDVAIIHNGMISNEKEFTRKYSTCDSEVIAHLYEENEIAKDLNNLEKITQKMYGWFTVLALSVNKDKRMIMDMFTDNGRLGSYYIKELETRIYSSWGDDVFKVANALGLTAVDEESYKSDTAFRVDVLTGEVTEHIKIKTTMIPVHNHNLDADWDIVSMSGNLSDEEFQKRWFRLSLPGRGMW